MNSPDHEAMMKELRRQAKRQQANEPVVLTQKQFRALRPARNIIVVMVWICLAFASSAQLLGGVSPDSVNDNLDGVVQLALAGTVVLVGFLNVSAGFIRHSGLSLGTEIFADLFGAGAFAIYALVIIETNERWWALASFAWATGMFVGCALRTVQIFRRGY